MWGYFPERVAAHPCGAAVRWFQYNDWFCLGRYDGMEAIRASIRVLYKAKNGERNSDDRKSGELPVIGYQRG